MVSQKTRMHLPEKIIFFGFFKLFELISLKSFINLEHLLFISQILPVLLSDPNKETLLPH